MVIEPVFDDVDFFSDQGLADVRTNGKWGIINTKGQWIIEPELDWRPGYARKELKKGKINGKWGLIDAAGQWVIEPTFEEIDRFSADGQAAAKFDGKWGLIDTSGQWILAPKFDGLFTFASNGLATAKLNDKRGFIDAKGQWVIEPGFDELGHFSANGLATAKIDGKWGLINSEGRWISKPKFCYGLGYQKDSGLRSARGSRYGGYYSAKYFMDAEAVVYRTGLNKNPEEPGYNWDFAGGLRTLFNRRGEKILTVDPSGEFEVARNAAGEIIWPVEDSPPREAPLGYCLPFPISTFSF